MPVFKYMNFATNVTYVNGMKWSFFDKYKRAIVFIDGNELKILVGENRFVFKQGDFFTSYNYKTNLIIINGEGFYLCGSRKYKIKNVKFKMPARSILDKFTTDFKTITAIQEFNNNERDFDMFM